MYKLKKWQIYEILSSYYRRYHATREGSRLVAWAMASTFGACDKKTPSQFMPFPWEPAEATTPPGQPTEVDVDAMVALMQKENELQEQIAMKNN